MINLNPTKWQGELKVPHYKDPRWVVALLLLIYVVLGITYLGFSRKPLQILTVVTLGAILDIVFHGVFKGKWLFPLSAIISCLSLSILLNFSFGYQYLWIPVFITISSKYLITLNDKHFFNPSLFGIVICLVFIEDVISLSPAYQWYGSVESSWVMGYFIVTASVLFFVLKIKRIALVLSFLLFFAIQTGIRAYILRFVIPPETLFIGALTSPAFYLFVFYMITDPATSPSKRSTQIWLGFFIAIIDFIFHLKFSLYTFFFAGIMVAGIRYVIKLFLKFRENSTDLRATSVSIGLRALFIGVIVSPLLFLSFNDRGLGLKLVEDHPFKLYLIDSDQTGIKWEKSNVLNEVDDRVRHISKWILSVGDAVAVADVNMDGLQDVFLTQMLKSNESRAKLYLNKGNFQFDKFKIDDLEPYLDDPKKSGLPGFSLFFDYDNDGDKDLFVGFGFGKSHLFENRFIPERTLSFVEVDVPYLAENNTICLAANAFDFNKDGLLDLFVSNTLPPYLTDYEEAVPFNIFDLPEAEYANDRRMLHFMHDSWHNSNNGGLDHLLLNSEKHEFRKLENEAIGLNETRWSLGIATTDINNDGYTDLYIANDFGRDDCYLNIDGIRLERQQGNFFGDIGLDTYKGMNASVADVDGNGKNDIYISNVHHALQAEGSLLWLNHTDDNAEKVTLEERAFTMNMLNPNRFGWGAAFVDINLDGWPDIVQANGMVSDDWDKLYEDRSDYWYFQAQIARTGPEIHSYADKWADIRGRSIYENERDGIFLNADGKQFFDVSELVGFNHLSNTRGVAPVDLDNDGDLDLIITDQYGGPLFYENQILDKIWLGIDLIGNGETCSKDAVGTKVYVTYTIGEEIKEQFREQVLVNGFSAQGDHRMVFGFGGSDKNVTNVKIKIIWFDGDIEVIEDIQLNTYTQITQN